jgi:hypothetical protein
MLVCAVRMVRKKNPARSIQISGSGTSSHIRATLSQEGNQCLYSANLFNNSSGLIARTPEALLSRFRSSDRRNSRPAPSARALDSKVLNLWAARPWPSASIAGRSCQPAFAQLSRLVCDADCRGGERASRAMCLHRSGSLLSGMFRRITILRIMIRRTAINANWNQPKDVAASIIEPQSI